MLIKKGGFGTQTPLSITGETSVAVQVKHTYVLLLSLL